MAINLNYSTGKSARPTSATFGTAPSQDPSGLQRAGQSLSQMANQFSNISNTLNQQDKSAQELVARKAYAVQQQAANESAQALNDAINNGNTEKIKEAQNSFNLLKDKTVNDYLPEDGGDIQVTREGILTNYGSQYKNLYGSLDRSTRSNKNIVIATKEIDTTSKKAESGWTQINLQYGAANAVPLEVSQQYLNDQFVLDVDRLNYDALPSKALKESFIENKLDVFNRAAERSFLHAKSDAEIAKLEEYYGNLFQSYELFNNIPQASEKYDKAVAKATEFVAKNKNNLDKEIVKEQSDNIKNGITILNDAKNLSQMSNAAVLLDAQLADVDPNVPDADYTIYETAKTLNDLHAPLGGDKIADDISKAYPDMVSPETVEAIRTNMDTPYSMALKSMVMTKPEDRPEVNQYWLDRPEFVTIASEFHSEFVSGFNNVLKEFDRNMTNGSTLKAMASVDPMIQNLVSQGKIAEANLYYREEYVNQGLFEGRPGFPADLADIETAGFELGIDATVLAGRYNNLLDKNVSNYEALYNNVLTALQDPDSTTKEQKNMYHLLALTLPGVIADGQGPTSAQLSKIVNNFAGAQQAYNDGTVEDKKDIDNLYERLEAEQGNYTEYSLGNNIFGEAGLKRQLMFLNIAMESENEAEAEFAENMVKGYLFASIHGPEKMSYKAAVKELAELENTDFNNYEAPIPIANGFVTTLPTEVRALVNPDIGRFQGQPLEELGQNIKARYAEGMQGPQKYGLQSSIFTAFLPEGPMDAAILQKGRESEVAEIYTMAELAYLAVSGFDPTNNKDLIEQFDLEGKFDWQDPRYYDSETGRITKLGAKGLIKGILNNTTDSGVPIGKVAGHSYYYENGVRKKRINLAFRNGKGYTKVQNNSIFNVDDALALTKLVLADEQNMAVMQVLGGSFTNQNLNRILDYLDEAGMFAEQFMPVYVTPSRIQKFPN
jgi:hypothetical protein